MSAKARIWGLDKTATRRIDENGAEEAHFLDNVRPLVNINAIANVVRMFAVRC